jgi:hypothetical protein
LHLGTRIDRRNPTVSQKSSSQIVPLICFSYLPKLDRIHELDYIPTETDIFYRHETFRHMSEVHAVLGSGSLRLCPWGGEYHRKWFHHLEQAHYIIFMVNLATYDQAVRLPGSKSMSNKLMVTIQRFNFMASRNIFQHTSILLYLENAGVLKRKLNESPLQDHFPSFKHGVDPDRAVEFFRSKFEDICRGRASSMRHFIQVLEDNVWEPSSDKRIMDGLGGLMSMERFEQVMFS